MKRLATSVNAKHLVAAEEILYELHAESAAGQAIFFAGTTAADMPSPE